MRTFVFLVTSLTIIGLAFWAYRENYETQSAMREVRKLQRQISDARERLRILNAEWAYLNRPERLQELVNMNFARLELVPLVSEQFSAISQIPYPVQTIAAAGEEVTGQETAQ